MAEMTTTTRNAVRVGILFTMAMIALLFFSLFLSGNGVGRDTYFLVAHFKEGQGLEVGSEVKIRGVPAGKVHRIEFDQSGPEGKRVKIVMAIDRKYSLPDDSIATVRFQSLLGQNFVYIIDGNSSRSLKANDAFRLTEEGADLQKVITQLSGLGDSAANLLSTLREKGGNALDSVNQVIAENRDNVKKTTDAFAAAAPRLESVARNLDEILANAREGKGTIGKFLTDDTAYNNITQISTDLRDVLAKVKSGEGTLGRLVNDDSLHKTLDKSFTDLGGAAREVQGMLGENREGVRTFIEKLSRIGPELEDTVRNAKEITAKVNEGKGTIGKLVNDPSLYNDVKRAVNQVGETFEGGEEQGVIRSFFGVLFGALL